MLPGDQYSGLAWILQPSSCKKTTTLQGVSRNSHEDQLSVVEEASVW